MVKGPRIYSDIGKKARDVLHKDYQNDHNFTITTDTTSQPHFLEKTMVKGPGFYSDIGKKARDLLYKDYQFDHKFTLTSDTTAGLEITSTGLKKGDLYLADVAAKLKNKNVTYDIKVDTQSNLFVNITTVDKALKTIASFVFPDQESSKVEVQYQHAYAGISASFGSTATPIVNFSGVVKSNLVSTGTASIRSTEKPIINLSGVFGNNLVSIGTDVSYNTASGTLTKLDAGLNFTYSDLIASLNLNEKGDSLVASYYQCVNPLSSTAVGAEFSHSFSSKENKLTIGTQHALDPLTLVKARVNNFGKAAALIQHDWNARTRISLVGEVDTGALGKSAKIGLALALKP